MAMRRSVALLPRSVVDFGSNDMVPSRRRARNASAAFRIFDPHPKKTFATVGRWQGHSAAARHPGAHGCGFAEDPARDEGARLSHRASGAGDAATAGDADRAAAMAIASAFGECADRALAENPQFRVCRG